MTAYTASNPVPMTALPTTSGVVQQFLVGTTNTGSSTFAPDGLAAAPIFGLGGAQLQGGEIVAEGIATLVSYVGTLLNSGSLCWILLDSIGGSLQVAPATQSAQASQFAQVLAASSPLCVLSYTNSTTLTLSRVRSGLIYSPGYGIVTVPSSGITYTASGLTASTLYYVYLNPNSGSPTLTLSTTGHTTDPTGVEVQTGNNALVLVGMAYALTATTIESTVRSWAHDPGYAQTVGSTGTSETTSTTLININAAYEIPFLNWAGEQVTCGFSVFGQVTSAGNGINNGISIDGAAPVDPITGTTAAAANTNSALSASATKTGLTEGRHISYLYGSGSSSAVTVTWPSGLAGVPRPSNSVSIPPRG